METSLAWRELEGRSQSGSPVPAAAADWARVHPSASVMQHLPLQEFTAEPAERRVLFCCRRGLITQIPSTARRSGRL